MHIGFMFEITVTIKLKEMPQKKLCQTIVNLCSCFLGILVNLISRNRKLNSRHRMVIDYLVISNPYHVHNILLR